MLLAYQHYFAPQHHSCSIIDNSVKIDTCAVQPFSNWQFQGISHLMIYYSMTLSIVNYNITSINSLRKYHA